jgi:hypothetical protein
MFEKYVDLVDRPPVPRSRGTLKKNLALKSPVYGGFRGRFRNVSDFSDILSVLGQFWLVVLCIEN